MHSELCTLEKLFQILENESLRSNFGCCLLDGVSKPFTLQGLQQLVGQATEVLLEEGRPSVYKNPTRDQGPQSSHEINSCCSMILCNEYMFVYAFKYAFMHVSSYGPLPLGV